MKFKRWISVQKNKINGDWEVYTNRQKEGEKCVAFEILATNNKRRDAALKIAKIAARIRGNIPIYVYDEDGKISTLESNIIPFPG